jgi:hypothetical protein
MSRDVGGLGDRQIARGALDEFRAGRDVESVLCLRSRLQIISNRVRNVRSGPSLSGDHWPAAALVEGLS